MQTIDVRRYPIPTEAERAAWPEGVQAVSDHWQGWIEPDDRSWIVFVAVDGTVVLFDQRDPDGGVTDPRGGSSLTCPPPPVTSG